MSIEFIRIYSIRYDRDCCSKPRSEYNGTIYVPAHDAYTQSKQENYLLNILKLVVFIIYHTSITYSSGSLICNEISICAKHNIE